MYFSFQDQFYEQVKGVAMSSPVSPIVANLYMKYFVQTVCSNSELLCKEMAHLRKALTQCKYPKMGFGQGEEKV